jgi:hypothetical protein
MSIRALPTTAPARPLIPVLVAIGAMIALTGCGDGRAAARPMVVGNPTQLADLYMDGQITDSKGYRYDIAIIPGINPTMAGAGDSYERAWGYVRRFGTEGLARDGKKNTVGEIYSFAFNDCAGDFTIKGIGRDYANTTHDVDDLINDKPFGWYAQIAYRTTWGYLLKPAGRLVLGTIGCVGGATVGTACGAVEGAGRVALATGDVATMGTIYPAGRLLWHQPAYLASIWNAEPEPKQDGHWGIRIIDRPDNANPPAVQSN